MSLKRDEIADPNSCLNKAADDEPIFVLRGNDPIAAAIVRIWAERYVAEKVEYNTDGILTGQQLLKAQQARALANMMDAWQARPRPAIAPATQHYQLPMSGKRQDGIFGRCACGVLWPCKLATGEHV